jgi:RHS repeat-associated protein
VYYFQSNHLGAPLRLTDEAGNVVWKATYDDFGKASIATNLIENNFRLPGQYYDAETGLHYNWHRYYDPSTGRYLTMDPARDGTNYFAYAGNNPYSLMDPEGLRGVAAEKACGVYQGDGGDFDSLGINYNPKDGFAASLSKGSDGIYYLAFRGTELSDKGDLLSDVRQAAGFRDSQYDQAQQLAKQVYDVITKRGDKVVFVGHSLGGGLATAASYATGGDAITFNSAALGIGERYGQGQRGLIEAHTIITDPLTFVNNEILGTPAKGDIRIQHLPKQLLTINPLSYHSCSNFLP